MSHLSLNPGAQWICGDVSPKLRKPGSFPSSDTNLGDLGGGGGRAGYVVSILSSTLFNSSVLLSFHVAQFLSQHNRGG